MGDIINILECRQIPVHKPGDEEYERSVATANLLYRFSRPTCVVQPKLPFQVQEIVRQARSQGITITIKNGGHSYAGFSTTDHGILLDLSKMHGVNLDMVSKTVTLKGGALWGHAYKQLVNGHHDGYVINGGRCPTVGVSGFVLGGGLGPFTRSFGMGCDTLKEAAIVTADGNLVTVKDTDDPKSDEGRLFWALCGAGGGNFGIVVELKMSVQKLQNKNGNVVAGRYSWFPKPDAMDDCMTTMNDFYTTNWPNQMTIDSTWICDLQQPSGGIAIRFFVYFDGNKRSFDRQIDTFVKQKDLAKQLKRRSLAEKSTRFLHETLVAQWSEEIKKAFPSNRSYSIYTSFVFKNNRARVKAITSIIRQEMKAFREQFRGERGELDATFIHSGGQATKRKRSATAFNWRDGIYYTYITVQWEDKWMERDMRGFLKKFKEKLRPFSMMERAAFINFADGSLRPNSHETAYYGNNRQELQRVKKIWDKDNFFNWAQGVRLPREQQAALESPSKVSHKHGREPRALCTTMDGDSSEMEQNSEQDADEESSMEESMLDEEDLTDTIAGQQWENYSLPPTDDFIGTRGSPYFQF